MNGRGDDAARIQSEINSRGITRIVHFTQSRNLAQILRAPEGIKSSLLLKEQSADVFNPNDPNRFDNHEDHISCSIEYPNYWMFRTMKQREKFFEEWAILLIKTDALSYPGTLFAPRNAAAGGGRLLATGSAGLKAMFAQSVPGAYGRTRSRKARMLDSVPTDDQAEVMVHRMIPLAEITGVVVPSEGQARLELARLAAIGAAPSVRWYVAPDLFSENVSTLVRDGIRPLEVEYAPDINQSGERRGE